MAKGKHSIAIDFDALLFLATCAIEKRSIVVKNKITGEEVKYKNRTEFWGRGKEISGALLQINKSRLTPYERDDFLIEDVQEVEDFSHARQILHQKIKSACYNLDSKKWFGYIGGKGNFREENCLLIPYKSNRDNLLKPVYYDEMKDHIISIGAEVINGKEVDDALATEVYSAYKYYKKTGNESQKVIGVAVDKDYNMVDGYWYNYNTDFSPRLIEGLGTIYKDKEKFTGEGVAFFYLQMLMGDTSDGYAPHVHSDVKWGATTAFNWLRGCCTHRQYWQKIVEAYKHLYPEDKVLINFRGDEVDCTWLSMMQEIAMFAWIHRKENDFLDIAKILDNLGVEYEQ